MRQTTAYKLKENVTRHPESVTRRPVSRSRDLPLNLNAWYVHECSNPEHTMTNRNVLQLPRRKKMDK